MPIELRIERPIIPIGGPATKAYADGKKDIEQEVTEAIINHMRADGTIDFAALRLERNILAKKREVKRIRAEKDKSEAMLAAVDRFIKIAERGTSLPHERPTRLLHIRGKIKPEFFVTLDDANQHPPIAAMRCVPWFDFRKLETRSDKDMIAFGRELVAEGIAQLPFPETVFVFPFHADGQDVSAVFYLAQREREIKTLAIVFIGGGKPVGMFGKDFDADDSAFYALAVLSSRKVIQTRRDVTTDAEVAPHYRGDSYFQVTISPPQEYGIGGGRPHASPRLHWRRGHIRRLPGRTTWVRATLVGASENGVIVHDYSG